MNLIFEKFLFNFHILFAIIIAFNNQSIILCHKTLPLRNVAKSEPDPNSSVVRKDTTISRKLAAHDIEWHYGEKWPDIGFELCGGSQQSPIRLMSSDAVRNLSLHFTLRNYNKRIRQAFIENNGHTVQLGFSDPFKASVYGSATNYRRFIFQQLHFHWGSYNEVGSEHTVDGYRGPMELHMVHYNSKYGDFDSAVDKPDGLMVLGTLYKISSRNSRLLSSIIKLVRNVPNYEDKSVLLDTFKLNQLLPDRKRPFFMYKGSLTSPPCYESVQWLVFKNPVFIGDAQERQFRKCRSEYINAKTGRRKMLSNNYRPIQAVNERQVIISS